VAATAPVNEINESAHIFVSSVQPILDVEGTPGFRLAASNTYTQEPIPIVIVPGEVGSYSFERE
jgi:hypothetical protein